MQLPHLFAAATPEPGQVHDALLLRQAADAVPVMLAYLDVLHLRYLFANRRYARSTGHTADSIVGLTAQQVLGDAHWLAAQPHVLRAQRGESVRYTRQSQRHDGRPRVLEISLQPHFTQGDAPGQAPVQRGIFVCVTDITHHWSAERAVRESEERMRKFSAATEEGIVFHRNGFILDGNEALLRMFGYAPGELIGRSIIEFVMPEYRETMLEYTRQSREDPYELAIRHKDGHAVAIEAVGKTMPLHDGDYRVVVARDITARKQAQERATFLSLHDPLTQLPNREHLMRQLARLLAVAQAQRTRVAVLFVDLDHFKTVNESLGHQAGDRLLSEVAQRLRRGTRAGDFVARVGGDQFVVLLPELPSRGEAAAIAGTLLARVSEAYTIGQTRLSLSPTIGISSFPEDGYEAGDLLRHADTAMQHAKDSERGTCLFYAPGMEGHSAEILQREHQLREAIFHNAFVLHYQPQVQIATGQLVGFEALVRWQHPERGVVGPDEFIPLAESRGLITAIGRWVMREACRQTKQWHDEGLPRVPVAVNLSALEFRQRDVVGEIARVLQETGLAPQYLEVEITESAVMQQADQTRETLLALRALGVAVTVDDFGTGYSSLAYLKRYPLDKLKVDRSFVADTPAKADDVAIVTAIVQLARALQLQSVAEGVETPEQLALLQSLGCDLAQGYGISRPLGAAQARAWMLERAAG